MSLGTGRPIILRDENCGRLGRILLNHPMASPTDVRLISLVELVAQKGEHQSYSALPVGYLTCSLMQLKSTRLWHLLTDLSTTARSR